MSKQSDVFKDEFGQPLQIAIDGLVATGKTTVGQEVANKLGILFLDTGMLYRAIALFAIETHINLQDEDACALVAESLDLHLMPPIDDDGRPATVLLGSRDITWAIRTPLVDQHVSQVSRHPLVRNAVRIRQHAIASLQPIVMVGRDIATVVLPRAQVKVMLTASLEERIRRRYLEIQARQPDRQVNYEQLVMAITKRDADDDVRTQLTIATHVINTDGQTAAQVVDQIVELANEIVRGSGATLKLPRIQSNH